MYRKNKSGRRPAPLRALDEHTAAHVAELFAAFGDTSRVRLLSVLARGERHVGALAAAAGLTDSAVSHHLRALRHLRLVETRKSGRQVFYRLDSHAVTLFRYGLNHVRHS
jgi:DNA-binding transcriptional ArsR family regulator